MLPTPVPNFDYDSSVSEFAVSKRAYLDARPDASFGYIAISALVLNTTPPLSEPRILLLQRAASDSEPHKWEPPGGACEDEDPSILYAAARELLEETGLQAARIGGLVGEPHFFTLSNNGRVCQFDFIIHVSTEDGVALMAKLDPKEHQRFVWATESEVRAKSASGADLDFTCAEVERTVLLSFEHSRRISNRVEDVR